MQLAGAALFIGVFGFLAVAAWAAARASERKAQARYALLAKAVEQPTEAAKLVIEFLREDEARRDREKRIQSTRDGMQGGAVLMAVGAGLAALLRFILPSSQSPISLVGVMLVLVGMIVFGFAYFSKPKA